MFFPQSAKNNPKSLLFLKVLITFVANMTQDLTGESHQPGRIEVVCGSMFSGKTEELIRRMKRARFARQRLIIFKPAMDTRYSEEDVVSHDHNAIPSTPVKTSAEILEKAGDVDVVGIDNRYIEAEQILMAINTYKELGIDIYVKYNNRKLMSGLILLKKAKN